MTTELLPVVDADDRVIDQRCRREIHALNLRHRAVHVLVFNDVGDLFLQKRSQKKDLNKGLWDTSAAGHVDLGEDYLASAQRELAEELGVSANLTAVFKLAASPELGMEFIQVYRCRHNGPFCLAADEIDEGAWLPPAEVNRRVDDNDPQLTATFKVIWLNLRLLNQ